MKKNFLYVLGIAAMLASCSNGELVDQKDGQVSTPDMPFDGKIALKTSGITVSQTRAAVEKWEDTPIRVWGVDKNGTGWNTETSSLFPAPNYYANAKVDVNGNVVFDNNDVYFYPLNSDVNFSFYSCSPQPARTTVTSSSIIAAYNITGHDDILWGEAEATNVQNGGTFAGYNARYFRKGGTTPVLGFKHLLTQLRFKAIKGSEGEVIGNSVVPVSVKNISVVSVSQANLVVGGANKGSLTGSGDDTDIPVYFGANEPYGVSVAPTDAGAHAGTALVLPAQIGSYKVKVTLAAMVNGKERVQTNEITITNPDGAFEAGKIYNVNLTIYGLRMVDLDATLEQWKDGGAIDQEVN